MIEEERERKRESVQKSGSDIGLRERGNEEGCKEVSNREKIMEREREDEIKLKH